MRYQRSLTGSTLARLALLNADMESEGEQDDHAILIAILECE